jgi:hypothetical protein
MELPQERTSLLYQGLLFEAYRCGRYGCGFFFWGGGHECMIVQLVLHFIQCYHCFIHTQGKGQAGSNASTNFQWRDWRKWGKREYMYNQEVWDIMCRFYFEFSLGSYSKLHVFCLKINKAGNPTWFLPRNYR